MTDDQFEKLARLIQEGHEDLLQKIDTLGAELRTEMHEGFASIRAELTAIRMRLDALEEKVAQHAGYAKEIDHILARVSFIEQKLGIKPVAMTLTPKGTHS